MPGIRIQLSEASGVPYYRQVEDQLAELIRAGQLPPSSKLPSVRELATQLLVSLITIRRAYADLEQAGLIVRRQGQGTFVAQDVAVASRSWAIEEALRILTEAVTRARYLGMSEKELLAHIGLLLAEEVHNETN